MNIVKEKEIGTIEQINVTPIKKYQFILGKLIPFWVLGMLVLSIGLLIARLAYHIQPAGGYYLFLYFPRYTCLPYSALAYWSRRLPAPNNRPSFFHFS